MVVRFTILHLSLTQVATKDESVLQVWERVRGPLRNALRTLGISKVQTAKRSDIAALDKIIDHDVPELRSAATRAGILLAAAGIPALPRALTGSAPVND